MSNHPYIKLAAAALAAAALVGCASEPAPPPEPTGPSPATTQALEQAQMAINSTQPPCTNTGNAKMLLAQARDAAQAGKDARAQDLAAQAGQSVEEAVSSCYQELASEELAQARSYSNLNANQQRRLSQGEQAYRNGEYRRAYEILSQLNAELESATVSYNVNRGDTLWDIAGQSDVYNNPWQWPLIFKANNMIIDDPDLIYPDQEFEIPMYPGEDAVQTAIEHAKNRDEWTAD